MKFDAAKLVVSKEIRDKILESKRRDIERLKADIKRYTSEDDAKVVSTHYPFWQEKDEDGAYDSRAGIIFDKQAAAQRMANLTGRNFAFKFNGVIHTMVPEEDV